MMGSPVTPLDPYETPKVKRMAADADLSSGTASIPRTMPLRAMPL